MDITHEILTSKTNLLCLIGTTDDKIARGEMVHATKGVNRMFST